MLIINPKRVSDNISILPGWYNYYAGYSHTFAESIIKSLNLAKKSKILDPWNGAGTTSYISSIYNYESIGIDLNPVMKIVAKSKQVSKIQIDSLYSSQKFDFDTFALHEIKKDQLSIWFCKESVKSIRKIENYILTGILYKNTIEKVNSLSTMQCFMYVALFKTLRYFLKSFIPSNPTWIKKPKSNENKISLTSAKLYSTYLSYLNSMYDVTQKFEYKWPVSKSNLIIGTSEKIPLSRNTVDLVLSSPPYCTRIDYGVATLPELSLICVNGFEETDQIRRSLMGTTTVSKKIKENELFLGNTCNIFLNDVKLHNSKASSTYYYKNLAQYFNSLKLSIEEITRVLKKGNAFICVIQNSYYKDIHCDLPTIITEIAHFYKLNLSEKIEFESKQNMVNLNAKSKRYEKKNQIFESILIFKKEN